MVHELSISYFSWYIINVNENSMNAFDFIHKQIRKRFGYTHYFQPNSELDDIKVRLERGMLRPVEAEKKITAFYKKYALKTKKFD